MVKKLLFALVALFSLSLKAEDAKLPDYKGHVNDFAGLLAPNEVQALEAKLKNYEDSTSTQIAVIIESGLNGSTPYDRAMAFARGWGVGSKEKNNGVVLYLAVSDKKEDRGYFTVVSQAAQGKLTDGIVGEIQRSNLVPHLRNKEYYLAIDETVSEYILALRGEFVAGANPNKDKIPGWVIFIVIFGIIFFIGLFNNSRYGRGYRRGGAYWFPGTWGGGGGGGGSSSGGGWGGFGGGGGFDGGGAGGSW